MFEPNDEPLWAKIRQNVGAFMMGLFRQGAFQGATPDEAFFVKCDGETTTAGRPQRRHRQHRGRVRAAQAGGVRRHQDPADAGQIVQIEEVRHGQWIRQSTPQRHDPYKKFKFRVYNGQENVLGVSKVGALKRTTEVVKHRTAARTASTTSRRAARRSMRSRSSAASPTITSSRSGPTWSLRGRRDASTNLAQYKRELTLEFLNERGQVAIRYFLHGCWVSEYTALPELDANGNHIALESLKIELEGWERDPQTVEPLETDDVPASPIA